MPSAKWDKVSLTIIARQSPRDCMVDLQIFKCAADCAKRVSSYGLFSDGAPPAATPIFAARMTQKRFITRPRAILSACVGSPRKNVAGDPEMNSARCAFPFNRFCRSVAVLTAIFFPGFNKNPAVQAGVPIRKPNLMFGASRYRAAD